MSLIDREKMSQLRTALTDVKSLISIIGSLVGLAIFVFVASTNASTAVADNKEQDVKLDKMKEFDHQLDKTISLIQKDMETTKEDVAEIKELLKKRYGDPQ